MPTLAERNGDFSATGFQPINPQTGQPFAAGQIPASQLNGASQYLLGFIPEPNLPGDRLNFHTSTLASSSSDSLSLRFTQNLSPTVQQTGRAQGAGRGGGFGGGRGGFGGRGGQGNRGTNIVLQGQLQYRRTENEALNVFPGLESTNTNTSITVPLSLNVVHNRTVNNFSVNFTHSQLESTNAFANVQNVGGLAGINYPAAASTDPQNWGVPRLSFTGFTGVSGAPATSRSDTRLPARYFWCIIRRTSCESAPTITSIARPVSSTRMRQARSRSRGSTHRAASRLQRPMEAARRLRISCSASPSRPRFRSED